jgi:hypothetical protein
LPRRQQQLVEPCPKCGDKTGFVVLRRWSRPDSKTYQGRPYEEKVNKRYPLESRPIPRESELSEAIGEAVLLFSAIHHFLPKLLAKHPELRTKQEYHTRGMMVLAKSLGMLTDNRTSFDPIDWFNIILRKNAEGYRRASQIYGVSVNQIKNREEEIEEFAKEVIEYGLGVQDSLIELIKILDNDPEIKTDLRKYIVAIKASDERIKKLKGIANVDLNPNREYEYYYIRHSNNNKTRSCGPFKESALSRSILEEYWRRRISNG